MVHFQCLCWNLILYGIFQYHFGALPYWRFSVTDPDEAYVAAINKDPGDSPADAIIHSCDEVAIWPAGRGWCLYGSRRFEISVIAASAQGILSLIDVHPL